MKVIQELVAYFDRAGRLDKAAIGRLLDQGFLASDAPMSMMGLCDTIGATYYFRVKGDASGTAWGTDVYTGDSQPRAGRGACGTAQARAGGDPQGDRGGAAAGSSRARPGTA